MDEGLLIPIVAIICTIGLPMIIGLVSVLTRHQHRMAEMMNKQERSDEGLRTDVQSLERKIDELRATLVDHAMSLDRSVEQMAHRIDALERRSVSSEQR